MYDAVLEMGDLNLGTEHLIKQIFYMSDRPIMLIVMALNTNPTIYRRTVWVGRNMKVPTVIVSSRVRL